MCKPNDQLGLATTKVVLQQNSTWNYCLPIKLQCYEEENEKFPGGVEKDLYFLLKTIIFKCFSEPSC